MTPEQITTELKDCKSTNRYVVDVKGDRFWVFGLPTGALLVRRIDNGMMKPLRTMQYDEIVSIEGMNEDVIEGNEHPATGVIYAGCNVGETHSITQRKGETMTHSIPENRDFCVSKGPAIRPGGELKERTPQSGVYVSCLNVPVNPAYRETYVWRVCLVMPMGNMAEREFCKREDAMAYARGMAENCGLEVCIER